MAGQERHCWNEFQWEREIRRDERRISCYFRELALCLDLPGEEEMIFGNLMASPGLVPAGADQEHWRMWDAMDDGSGDDEENGAVQRKRRPGDELPEQIDRLACEWNVIFAAGLRPAYREAGLAVSCAFGKLLARISDFNDTGSTGDTAGLKISLGKRALQDINTLAGMLAAAAERQKSIRTEILLITELLLQTRERLTDLMQQLRREHTDRGARK